MESTNSTVTRSELLEIIDDVVHAYEHLKIYVDVIPDQHISALSGILLQAQLQLSGFYVASASEIMTPSKSLTWDGAQDLPACDSVKHNQEEGTKHCKER